MNHPNGTIKNDLRETRCRFLNKYFAVAFVILALSILPWLLQNKLKITDNVKVNVNEKAIKSDLAYDPMKMVKFIDLVLNSNLDDFITVEKTSVKIQDLVKFNNVHFAPRISSIVRMDPFKFAKFNLNRPCILWPDTFSCTKLGCNIEFCEKLPQTYLDFQEGCPSDSPKALSKLDQTLPQENVEELNTLFECSRDDSDKSQYYDLVLNPERFTGYDGRQIWKAIYEENCFVTQNGNNIFSSLDKRCYEERVFYRSISGLHSSITTHLTSIHHKFKNQFGTNPSEYYKRFYGNTDHMKNLFFIYLIELRALYKSEPYLLSKIRWNSISDKVQARDAIKALLSTENLFKWHFDEQILFKPEAQPLTRQLAAHFHNITYNIMDCVSCDKCRLWGKVQTNGLGTAFKILLTKDTSHLKLSHHEVTCLLNALARISYSISEVSNFKEIFQSKIETPQSKSNFDDHGFLNYID